MAGIGNDRFGLPGLPQQLHQRLSRGGAGLYKVLG